VLQLTCLCGETIDLPASFIGQPADCPACSKPLRAVAAAGPEDDVQVTARLLITKGPERIGEQFFLSGDQSIEIGKLPEKLISLPGTMVSRNHCRLVPRDRGWVLEDLKSTNGIFINNTRVQRADLKAADVVRIGDYELLYEPLAAELIETNEVLPADFDDAYELATLDLAAVESTGQIVPDAPYVPNVPKAFSPEPVRAKGTGPECPCCEVVLAPKAKICVTCGIKIPSGRPLATARGMDENFLYERTHGWLQLISFILRIGLLPVASEAFGTKKARSVWVIFALTFVVSAIFLIVNWGEQNTIQYGNLMLWSGSNVHQQNADTVRRKIEELFPKSGSKKIIARRKGTSDDEDSTPLTPEEIEHLVQQFAHQAPQPTGEFHAYQLVTHALLHGGILHFAGNMVFLLVFGLRVNELVGDLKFAIIYPILAVAAGLSYMASTAGQSLHPMLGASGAVMGLAGMYFVLFPVQRVHIAFWFRFGWITGMYLKMFRMRGFWLLVFWIAFNDLLPMAMAGHGDHVAHWAHLGGFMSGMAIALILLASRLSTARGADLLSFTLGKYAWPVLGKPNMNLEAPTASPARQRLVIPSHYA
jgi:membrane associated rhomboid family serine protease